MVVFMFGTGVWHAYLAVTLVEQRSVLTDWSGVFLNMMPTVFGSVRSLGADPSFAATAQWTVSIAAGVVAIWLFVKDRSRLGRTFALLCATLLVSPYAFYYDMGALAVAAAVMVVSRTDSDGMGPVTLAAVAVLPAFVLPLSSVGAPVAPVVLAAALWARLKSVSKGWRT